MPNAHTRKRTTGHQAILARALTKYGHFWWSDLAPYAPIDQRFRDAMYKAVQRLRARGWIIRERHGQGYLLIRPPPDH